VYLLADAIDSSQSSVHPPDHYGCDPRDVPKTGTEEHNKPVPPVPVLAELVASNLIGQQVDRLPDSSECSIVARISGQDKPPVSSPEMREPVIYKPDLENIRLTSAGIGLPHLY